MVKNKGKRSTRKVKSLPASKLSAGRATGVRGGSRKMPGVRKWPNLVLKRGSTGE